MLLGNPLLRSSVLVLLLCCLAGCAAAPAARLHDDVVPAEAEAPEEQISTKPDSSPYGLELEGTAPEPEDVEFEEDRLPLPPEQVGSESLEEDPVASESVDEPGRLPPLEPAVSVPVEPSVQLPVPENRGPTARRGFRVQLSASGERMAAESAAAQARTRMEEAVYVVFESPYYKVRAGDFSDRAAALRLRDRCRAYGFPNAWVVTTTILDGAKEPNP